MNLAIASSSMLTILPRLRGAAVESFYGKVLLQAGEFLILFSNLARVALVTGQATEQFGLDSRDLDAFLNLQGCFSALW